MYWKLRKWVSQRKFAGRLAKIRWEACENLQEGQRKFARRLAKIRWVSSENSLGLLRKFAGSRAKFAGCLTTQKLLRFRGNSHGAERAKKAGYYNGISLRSLRLMPDENGKGKCELLQHQPRQSWNFVVDVWSEVLTLLYTNSGSQKKKTSVTMLEFN